MKGQDWGTDRKEGSLIFFFKQPQAIAVTFFLITPNQNASGI